MQLYSLDEDATAQAVGGTGRGAILGGSCCRRGLQVDFGKGLPVAQVGECGGGHVNELNAGVAEWIERKPHFLATPQGMGGVNYTTLATDCMVNTTRSWNGQKADGEWEFREEMWSSENLL